MPGVLIVEAMAQMGGAFFLKKSRIERKSGSSLPASIRLVSDVCPAGDQLRLEVTVLKRRQNTCKMQGWRSSTAISWRKRNSSRRLSIGKNENPSDSDHPPDAEIPNDVEIGPYCIVGEGVRLERATSCYQT